MRDQKKAEEIAVQRFQLFSPLLADGLDAGKAKELKNHICKTIGLSERTIMRYLEQYHNESFEGIKPKGISGKMKKEAIPSHLLDQAILLRKEAPTRSFAQSLPKLPDFQVL
ncbi:helix-turn-helix domain-containing protein [Neobacillus sp. 114]|uniref:helix-turn-helix domain-containing protein n=1 Tax=Neobacillus sp. 114 TaxID=3048535 RepID=UPI0024C23660|nr:helix-turn-helix domain-containing protein [Neobacillus sp. 114]